ncbi:helix-turn-helix transcriptional regulator [Novosphingobium sp.]|jgi:AraC-like DNA-binding protein|uniref:helix-turn-helix transcriptional regulator n=1 Tax=Novosphingobium sp. TaxID=1874826 RepID=UPI002FE1F510
MPHRIDPRLTLSQRLLAQAGPDLPKPVGLQPEAHFDGTAALAGRGMRLSIRPGFDLSAFELDARGASPVSATTEPCLAVVVLLSGEGEGQIDRQGTRLPATPYRAGNFYISLARETVTGVATAKGTDPFRIVELRLSIDFLERTGAIAAFTGADTGHPLHHASCPGFWLGSGVAPPEILDRAEALLQLAFAERPSDLHVEALALALFGCVGEIMREPSRAMPRKIPTPTEDRLDRIRATMRQDLAHPWSITELASAFAINTRRLKEGYRLRFGKPVNGDLQSMRMEGGLQLLQQGHGVMEASLQVGYANPSHFARLFRRHFGVTPKAWRNIRPN